MSQTVLDRTAERIAESAHQASRATSAVASAIDDGVGVVRRAAKQSGDAAEDCQNTACEQYSKGSENDVQNAEYLDVLFHGCRPL